jgi:hypothetical protein
MACKEGQRQAVAALCAVVAWSLFVTPAAAMSAALHFGAPTKISRMSFDVPAYPAAFFEASHIMHLESEHKTFTKFIGSHHDFRSVAAIECALETDEDSSECQERSTMRLRGGQRHRKPAWMMESLHQRREGKSTLRR